MFLDANITVNTNRFEESVTFYTERLNLNLQFRQGTEWAEFKGPGITIGLNGAGPSPDTPPSSSASAPSIGFAVEEIEVAVSTLKERGIAFPRGIEETPLVKMAVFEDPSGNPLYLYQIKNSLL